MHKLEITGATPEDLYMNSVRMLSMLLKGGATTMAPDQAQQEAPSVVEPPSPTDGADLHRFDLSEEEGVPRDLPAAPKKRGKAKADKVEMPSDPLPDMTGAKTIEHEPQKLTLDDDIKPRLRAIQKAHAERGNDMPTCVAFIQKLYGPFGIAKADQLKPEQFAEFMEASEGYLSGEA